MLITSLLLQIQLMDFKVENSQLNLNLESFLDEKQSYTVFIDNQKTKDIEIQKGNNLITVPIIKQQAKEIILKNVENTFFFPLINKPKHCEQNLNSFINEINIEEDFIEIYNPQSLNHDFLYQICEFR